MLLRIAKSSLQVVAESSRSFILEPCGFIVDCSVAMDDFSSYLIKVISEQCSRKCTILSPVLLQSFKCLVNFPPRVVVLWPRLRQGHIQHLCDDCSVSSNDG